MVKRGEVGLAQILSMYQSHPWLFFKVKMLHKALQNFSSWFPEIKKEDDEADLLCQMINLEIFVTTLHYAEVLAANLLAFRKKRKRFHKTLLSYKGSEIFDFYKKIKHRRLSYIANLLGYPPLFQIDSEEGRNALRKSCIYVKQRLSEIGDRYLKFNSLYNAYKHGLRVGVAQSIDPKDEKPYAFVVWPLRKEELSKAMLMRLGKPEIEIELCEFMLSVLGAVTETFRKRVMKKEESFNVIAFTGKGHKDEKGRL